MSQLKRAHQELFRRAPDECYDSLPALIAQCQRDREASQEHWHSPAEIEPRVTDQQITAQLGSDGAFALNHWSFSQLCGLCGVSRDTINVLTPATASRALLETRPQGAKPLQMLTRDDTIRALHGTQYSRLWNADLLDVVRQAAPDFTPPQKAATGGTGLYCGEQDVFAFLIDPAGWIEIGDQAFAPGMFAWNSEVGKRSLGVETFWFQAICGNHVRRFTNH